MGCFQFLLGKKKRSQQKNMLLQSPSPRFRDRVEPVHPNNNINTTRARDLSTHSGLHEEKPNVHLVNHKEQLDSKFSFGSMKEHININPQPLPLPLPQNTAIVENWNSKVSNISGPSNIASPQPQPLPQPPTIPISLPLTLHHSLCSIGILRNFSFEELATACNGFCPDRCMSGDLSSMVYRATFEDDRSKFKKLEATVTCINSSIQSLKEFLKLVNTLGCLQYPYICKLLGYHAHEGSEWRMLVYQRLYHGSLDKILYESSNGPFLDWSARIKVATCVSKGLTFLHEDGPFQVMFREFSTGNIQIDKDYSAKLSGYGCVSHIPETDIFNNLAPTSLLVEVQKKGIRTPKSNVWGFGIVLLELLTGRRNHDNHHPKEERNLIKWCRPFLSDDSKLSLIMDPRLQGRFPIKAAQLVADIAQRCLQINPLERPTMRTILEHLTMIQRMKYTSQCPLQEPGSFRGKNVSKSPSLSGIITPRPRLGFSSSQNSRLCVSPPRSLGLTLSLPSQSHSPTLSLKEFDRRGQMVSSSTS